jgi:hypothetical protein
MTAFPARVRSKPKPLVLLGVLLVALAAVAVALLLPGLGSARTAIPGEPTISGSTTVGSTLTGTHGTWAPNAVTYKYNWRRCPPDGGQGGGNCDGIVDGPSNTYVLTGYDVGFTIRLQVKAWDSAGNKICIDVNGVKTCAVSSNATAVVTGQGIGPTNTALPTITGTAAVGQTLTASQGSWDRSTSFLAEYSYDWLRCNAAGASCTTFGAKAQTYVVGQADQGSTLRVRVTATNPAGSTQVNSAQTAVVPGGPAAPPPPPPPPGSSKAGCPSTRGTVQIAAVTSPLRLVVDRQIVGATLTRSSGQSVTVRYHVSDTCGRSVQGALVYATAVPFGQLSTPAEQATGQTGYASLTFQTLAGFPLGRNQRNVAIFVRARKQGEDLLAGVSTRRLFAIPISR